MFFVSGHRDGPVQNSAWLPEKETRNCLSTVRRTEVKSPPFFQNRIGFDHISILLFTYTQKKSLQTDALHLELYFEESLITILAVLPITYVRYINVKNERKNKARA